jgi:preprotein translocase subunit SecF
MSPDRILPGSAGPQPEPPKPPPAPPPVEETRETPADTLGEEPFAQDFAPLPKPPAAEPAPAVAGEAPLRPPRYHGPLRRLYYGQTKFDFVRRRRWWFALSTIVIAAGIISLATRGLNLDIEFTGGNAWIVPTSTVTVAQARTALAPFGLAGVSVTTLGSPQKTLEVEAKLPAGLTPHQAGHQKYEVELTLARLAGVPMDKLTIDHVGPSWGRQITQKALEALIVFFIVVSIYISIFFEWRMALAAIIAVLHDILVTVGVYSLVGFDVTPDTVVAFLTILGYSLYDTIVVFDRVRDNAHHLAQRDRMVFSDLVNLSMNQTLARSINTSLVAILPILSVLVIGAQFFGAVTLQYFGLALTIGLMTGAYSSIFIASPLVAMMKEREPHYRQLTERLRNRGVDRLLLSPADIAAGALGLELPAAPRRSPLAASAARRAPAPWRREPAAAPPAEPGTATPAAAPRRSGPARPVRRPKARPAARRRRKGGRH